MTIKNQRQFRAMSPMQIKPDPVAKKEYFAKTFCESDSLPPPPPPQATDDDSDSDSSGAED